MILKLKSPFELYTREGRKEFKPGNYNIEEQGIDLNHWFLRGLLKNNRAEIIENGSAPAYKHLPDSEIMKKAAPAPIDINKPFTWEQVVGKEEVEVEEIKTDEAAEEKQPEEAIVEEKKDKIKIDSKKLKRK